MKLAAALILLYTVTAVAGPSLPKMPAMSTEQKVCMQKALGKNFHPSAKQISDAVKGCAKPPAAAATPAAAPEQKDAPRQ